MDKLLSVMKDKRIKQRIAFRKFEVPTSKDGLYDLMFDVAFIP